MQREVRAARVVCAWLCLLDIALGAGALFAPRLFMRVFAPRQELDDYSLVRRTGALWLFFAPVQAWAAVKASDTRALRAVAVLRLQEIAADSVWLMSGKQFGLFGRLGIASAPLFNAASGTFLLYLASRLDKERAPAADRR